MKNKNVFLKFEMKFQFHDLIMTRINYVTMVNKQVDEIVSYNLAL